MTTMRPRPPYTVEEIRKLYPPGLRLQLVQVFFRHGERTPEHARFQNVGMPVFLEDAADDMSISVSTNDLAKDGPSGNAAKQMVSAVMTDTGSSSWSTFEWQRRLETMESSHLLSKATESSCSMAELTDRGRLTTLDLGRRLRHLYVRQLGFLPERASDMDMVYLRCSPWPRTLNSLQQVFTGLYPPGTRDSAFGRPTIVTRRPHEETLMPNEDFCPRFIQLAKAFSRRSADRWNHSHEMHYLNNLLQKWMPAQQRVAVDSTPKLHGIWDTINSTLATPGPPTRLPPEFYDPRARSIIDGIVTEEEYAGFKESAEYRTVGIGALMGEVVRRMVAHSLKPHMPTRDGGELEDTDTVTDSGLRIALFGCHDSTLAAILASLGALEGEHNTWPSYTSSLAVELFRSDTTQSQRYVRIRYNDSPIMIPGCRIPKRHLEGDESFCDLAAFKEIVDKFTPRDWKTACGANLREPAFPTRDEPAGY